MVVIIKLAKHKAADCWRHVKNFMFWLERVFWTFRRFIVRLVQSKK